MSTHSIVSLPRLNRILSPEDGYNAVADTYDQWHWSDFWNTYEAPLVHTFIGQQVRGGTVLDAGSGTGRYRAAVERRGLNYIGVDVSSAMLDMNDRKAATKSSNLTRHLYISDLRECPVPSGTIDAVLCARALSHVDDLCSAFSEFQRILRNGGVCMISDIHADHPYKRTSIPGKSGRASIATYKWTREQIMTAIHHAGKLVVTHYKEYSLNQLLTKPDPVRYEKLYASRTRPIFYVLNLRKDGG